MKKLILVSVFFLAQVIHAQDGVSKQDFENRINALNDKLYKLEYDNIALNNEILNLNSEMAIMKDSLRNLGNKLSSVNDSVNQKTKQLNSELSATKTTTDKKLNEVDQSIGKNTWYLITGILTALIVSLIIYILLNKKQNSSRNDVESKLNQAKKTLEEEQVSINTRLAEMYNTQMQLMSQERKISSAQNVDHSLPLKVADEIVKMQMNLAHMDPKIKGHKQLTIAVNNVLDNFKANGYEITELLNKPFNEGLNIQATMEPDPNLADGEKFIRRVIKPEVLYNNKVIQNAQVIVAYGE